MLPLDMLRWWLWWLWVMAVGGDEYEISPDLSNLWSAKTSSGSPHGPNKLQDARATLIDFLINNKNSGVHIESIIDQNFPLS